MSAAEELLQRLRGDRGDGPAGRPGVLPDRCGQPDGNPDGETSYFKYGCSNATFSYLRSYLWKQVVRWQGREHQRTPWKQLRRRYGIWPTDGGVELFDPARVSARRYYYRGTKIATPWPSTA